ncbi:MAG TPA: CpaF family protein [Acidimicrobiia bacterium]|nr:CpaF family protein [Acidimicrobiia bacterium]
MKLSDRLKAAEPGAAAPEPTNGSKPQPAPELFRDNDPLADLKSRAKEDLFGKLEAKTFDASLNESDLKRAVIAELERVLDESATPLSEAERERIAEEISIDILGYGPIQRYLEEDEITEIMVNGTSPIFVERAGRLHKTSARFSSDAHLRQVIERIVAKVGRRVDESSPMVDARLPDGSRVNAIVPPLAVDGPALTIRKFAADPYRIEDLVEFGTLTVAMATLLKACVQGKLNLLITGGTGTGKTTLLNVLSSFVPGDERIVTIEDAVELQLLQEHVVRLEARPPNVEGRGSVTIRDLVRNALRMRPDRIIVGEVRGPEALDMMQAMNTGHEGSMSTVHSNTPRDALSRLETMILMSGLEIPVSAIREYIASALSVIVHLGRLSDGSRRVTRVAEVVGMEGDVITMQDIFHFKQTGVEEDGKVIGRITATGIRPKFADNLLSQGLLLPSDLFGPAGRAA